MEIETDYILLVEDNEDDMVLLKYALQEAGIRNPLHWVQTAESAMNYLAGQGEYADRIVFPVPRIIFVDLKLPGQSGHDLLKWINTRDELAGVVRIVLTGSNDPRDRRAAIQLGANSYLEKPLTPDQLTSPSRSLRMFFASSIEPV